MIAERLVEAALMLALPLRVAGAVSTVGLRRKLAVHPRVVGGLVVLALGLVAVMAATYRSDAVWRVLAAAAAVLVVIEAWRARPAFGRRRGLPPGSLAIARRRPWTDPDFIETQIARHGPVFKMSNFVQPTVCIADLELGRELLRSHDEALSATPLPFSRLVPGGFVRYRPPATHRAMSARIRESLDPDVMAGAEPELDRLFRQCLEAIADGPEIAPRRFVESAVRQFFLRVFFGIEPGSRRAEELLAAMALLDVRNGMGVSARAERAAIRDAQAIVLAEPGGFLAVAAARQPLDDELVVNLLYVATTTSGDVASLVCWILRRLADNPGWLERIRADGSGAVAEHVVSETLRLSQSEYIARRADRTIRFGDILIPAGYHVRVCIREIHRDPRSFADPLAFDPDRFATPVSGTTFAPLGISRIRCPGGGLTTVVGRSFARALAGYDLRVLQDGPVELGPFHWQPSSRFRVGLTRRGQRPVPDEALVAANGRRPVESEA